ncbi:MAG: tRNA uridine-5-carboxymethylaminomethyl(34) synthesis GTPase MnmE [Bacteroidetes bacterium]|nr:tRNA uridine-5-carboxymethylaminomethyl(34) synthesis GTPase MnmE [Bacteroidota bacterium]
MVRTDDCIVARATPAGTGAIAVVRISGRNAFAITDRILAKPLTGVQSHTAHLRWLQDNRGNIDQALCTVFAGPNSYTGEDTIEISVHGSEWIVQRLLMALTDAGARPAGPGEFTLRAFLNGKLDLAQAEAVADVIAAESNAGLRAALDQIRGGYSAEIKLLRQKLVDFASLIELELDFSEEDVEFASRSELKSLVSQILTRVQQLRDSFRAGNVLKNGVTVVLAGRPNAGKSTLFNRLLNEERAIVSDIAGTTRDTIEDILHIAGITYRLVDTAGIREATDTIEKSGIERTLNSVQRSTVTLYIFDAVVLTPEDLAEDILLLRKHATNILPVGNKLDKLSDHQRRDQLEMTCGGLGLPLPVWVSATLEETTGVLKDLLFSHTVESGYTAGDTVVVTNVRHAQSLQECETSLAQVLTGMDQGIGGDLLAFHIREALHQLGAITGEITTDDLLDNIFSKFCIGK